VRIYKSSTDHFADKDGDGFYVCGFKKKNNDESQYERFRSIEDAAVWLCKNPTWGIRMNPGWSLIHRGIVIERDG
jgi:hypothetical protein